MESANHNTFHLSADDFLDLTDKDFAAYFVGREKIISEIERTVGFVQRMIEMHPNSDELSSQQTWLIQGAPGAGKTALTRHLQSEWLSLEDGPSVVRVHLSTLRDESKVTEAIANQLVPSGGKYLRNSPGKIITAGFNLIGASISRNVQTQKSGGLELNDLKELYRAKLLDPIRQWISSSYPKFVERLPFLSPKTVEMRVIVLIIDEIQGMKSEYEELLKRLHEGIPGLPIVMILAGLAYSRKRLRQAGISRFASNQGYSHVQMLDPLSHEDTAKSVDLMLNANGISEYSDDDYWFIVNDVATWSQGWPQHLLHCQQALLAELKENNFDLSSIDDAVVYESANRSRISYYKERLADSTISESPRVLAEVAKIIGCDGCSSGELLSFLKTRVYQEDKDPERTMLEEMTPWKFVEEMILAGVVHKVDGRVFIPIPSFQRYLMGSYQAWPETSPDYDPDSFDFPASRDVPARFLKSA